MTKPSNRWDFLFLCYQRCKVSCYAHTSRFNNSKYKFPSWRDVSHCSKIQSHWWYKSHVVCLRGSQIGYKYWANGCAKIHLCAGIAHPKPRRMLPTPSMPIPLLGLGKSPSDVTFCFSLLGLSQEKHSSQKKMA